jgi:hypothetical protein
MLSKTNITLGCLLGAAALVSACDGKDGCTCGCGCGCKGKKDKNTSVGVVSTADYNQLLAAYAADM